MAETAATALSREQREDSVILEALAESTSSLSENSSSLAESPSSLAETTSSVGPRCRRQYLRALEKVWKAGPGALEAMARHMDISQEEVKALLQEEENREQDEAVVVELTVSFPGLNLPSLTYLLCVSLPSLLLTQCCPPCPHPSGLPTLRENHCREAQFGVSLSSLLEVCRASLPSLRLPHLTSLLREARVYFWPLARVSRALGMEPSRGEQSEGSQGEVRLVRGEGGSRRRRVKGVRLGVGGSARISLVGLATPTVLSTRKRGRDVEGVRTVDSLDKGEREEGPAARPGDISIRKVTEALIPIADIHARIPHCSSKYSYYGSHSQILDPGEGEQCGEPLLYDSSGQLSLSEEQQLVLARLGATIGTGQNSWQYCCQVFFRKYPNFQPTGGTRFDKDVLEVYLKMQYFATLKKSLLTTRFSKDELSSIRILLKYFWANSTVICNHFSRRSHESVCKEMEKLQKLPQATDGFLVSLRLLPLHLASQEKELEQLQEEVWVLLLGDSREVHLLPCSHSSIVCPHRTFSHIQEVTFTFDLEAAVRGEEEGRFRDFLLDTAEREAQGEGREYRGESLGCLVARRREELYRLPGRTLAKLNGMKRLRDAGFKTEGLL